MCNLCLVCCRCLLDHLYAVASSAAPLDLQCPATSVYLSPHLKQTQIKSQLAKSLSLRVATTDLNLSSSSLEMVMSCSLDKFLVQFSFPCEYSNEPFFFNCTCRTQGYFSNHALIWHKIKHLKSHQAPISLRKSRS